MTNPLDVIKSQRQAGLIPKSQSSLNAARQLINDFGAVMLYRGFEYRLLHKALATLVGFMVLANSENSHTEVNQPLDETKRCKM